MLNIDDYSCHFQRVTAKMREQREVEVENVCGNERIRWILPARRLQPRKLRGKDIFIFRYKLVKGQKTQNRWNGVWRWAREKGRGNGVSRAGVGCHANEGGAAAMLTNSNSHCWTHHLFMLQGPQAPPFLLLSFITSFFLFFFSLCLIFTHFPAFVRIMPSPHSLAVARAHALTWQQLGRGHCGGAAWRYVCQCASRVHGDAVCATAYPSSVVQTEFK